MTVLEQNLFQINESLHRNKNVTIIRHLELYEILKNKKDILKVFITKIAYILNDIHKK
jgi:hypothetical protein